MAILKAIINGTVAESDNFMMGEEMKPIVFPKTCSFKEGEEMHYAQYVYCVLLSLLWIVFFLYLWAEKLTKVWHQIREFAKLSPAQMPTSVQAEDGVYKATVL